MESPSKLMKQPSGETTRAGETEEAGALAAGCAKNEGSEVRNTYFSQ